MNGVNCSDTSASWSMLYTTLPRGQPMPPSKVARSATSPPLEMQNAVSTSLFMLRLIVLVLDAALYISELRREQESRDEM